MAVFWRSPRSRYFLPMNETSTSAVPSPPSEPKPPHPLLRFFAYEHLPQRLQGISRPLGDMARAMDALLPDGLEKSAGMRKLLEAKDCFCRAALPE